MQENCTYGSEGGEGLTLPYPYQDQGSLEVCLPEPTG